MPRVGIELKIPAFERGKTVHDSDRSATVIDRTTVNEFVNISIHPCY